MGDMREVSGLSSDEKIALLEKVIYLNLPPLDLVVAMLLVLKPERIDEIMREIESARAG